MINHNNNTAKYDISHK